METASILSEETRQKIKDAGYERTDYHPNKQSPGKKPCKWEYFYDRAGNRCRCRDAFQMLFIRSVSAIEAVTQ